MKTTKNSFLRHWFLPIGVICVAIILAITNVPASDTATYVRYVGPPLQDGSRVTFLHPATVSKLVSQPSITNGTPFIVQDVQIVKPVNIGQSIFYRLPAWKRAHPTEDLSEGVMVTSLAKLRLPSSAAMPKGRIQQERQERALPGYGSVYEESVFITDTKSGLQYDFEYQHLGTSASADFRKHKATITNSFQILPAGAAVPVP